MGIIINHFKDLGGFFFWHLDDALEDWIFGFLDFWMDEPFFWNPPNLWEQFFLVKGGEEQCGNKWEVKRV